MNRCGTDSEKWTYYGADVLPLWVADLDFRSPEPVVRALRERVEHGVFGYGVEPPELREVIQAHLKAGYGWEVPAESLLFVPGVVRGFNLACQAFTSPGDGILVQTPAYPPILDAPGNAGCERGEAELLQQTDGRYGIEWRSFAEAISERTRLFILCNPHNPVGRVFTRRELEGMAEICLRHGLLICSDEIHCDFVYSGQRHIPIAALDAEVARRTITLMAPSKTYNLAGLHFAVAIVTDPDLRKRFWAARRGLLGGPDILSLVAALAAYQHGQPWLKRLLRYLEANRDLVCDWVRDRRPGIEVAKPEGTYLTWLDCREAGIPGNAQEFFLQRARVALNDGPDYGRGGEGFLRLNFGCPRSMLVEALTKMEAALAKRQAEA